MATVPAGSTGRVLLCVAPLVPAGGVDTLLTAFGMLADDRPDLAVQVVGGGPLSRVLRTHADYLGVAHRVTFRGSLATPAVRVAVRRCAVLVLPHRNGAARTESAAEPALLEALSAGCPVVATRPAAPHLTSRGTALLVRPDAPTVLAQALETALSAPVRADLAGPAGISSATGTATVRNGRLLRRAWARVVR